MSEFTGKSTVRCHTCRITIENSNPALVEAWASGHRARFDHETEIEHSS